MISSNLDRTEERIATHAPFESQCPLQIGAVSLPSCSFVAVQLCVAPGTSLPARLSGVRALYSPDTLELVFSGYTGTEIGTSTLTGVRSISSALVSACILNKYKVITGHVTMQRDVVQLMHSACVAAGGTVSVPQTDFLLIPECVRPMPSGCMRSVGLDGVYSTADFTLHGSGRMELDLAVNSGVLTANGIGQVDELQYEDKGAYIVIGQNGINTIVLQNTSGDATTIPDLEGYNISIRAGITSNLRVRTGAGEITFGGVLDATVSD